MGYQGFHKDWLYGQFLGRTKGVYALCPLHLQINIVHLHIILQTNNIAWGGRMQNENVPHALPGYQHWILGYPMSIIWPYKDIRWSDVQKRIISKISYIASENTRTPRYKMLTPKFLQDQVKVTPCRRFFLFLHFCIFLLYSCFKTNYQMKWWYQPFCPLHVR